MIKLQIKILKIHNKSEKFQNFNLFFYLNFKMKFEK